jgi:hypothetical protein
MHPNLTIGNFKELTTEGILKLCLVEQSPGKSFEDCSY